MFFLMKYTFKLIYKSLYSVASEPDRYPIVGDDVDTDNREQTNSDIDLSTINLLKRTVMYTHRIRDDQYAVLVALSVRHCQNMHTFFNNNLSHFYVTGARYFTV